MNGTVGMESGLKLIRPSCGAIFVLRSLRSENASRDSNESTGFHIVLHIFFFFAFLLFVREIILFSRSNRPNMYREIPTTKRKNDDTNDKWIRNNRESLNWNITDENNRHLVRKGYQGTDAMITDRFLFSFHGPILLTWRLYWPLHHRIETDKEISPRLRLFIAVNNHAKCMRTMKI